MRRGLVLGALIGGAAAIWRHNQREQNATPVMNKVVLVTGAAGGIGRATAHAFGREQAHLLLVDSDAAVLEVTTAELRQYGSRVAALALDLTDEDAPARIMQEALQLHGQLDVVVNNAGLRLSGAVTSHSLPAVRQMIELNVLAVLRLSQAAVGVMQQQHSGHIVHIASSTALMPSPGDTVYGATQGAVRAFSRGLQRELQPQGVRVSCIFIVPVVPGTHQAARQPQDAAAAVLRAVVYHESDIVVGPGGRPIVSSLERISPWLVDRLMARRWGDEAARRMAEED